MLTKDLPKRSGFKVQTKTFQQLKIARSKRKISKCASAQHPEKGKTPAERRAYKRRTDVLPAPALKIKHCAPAQTKTNVTNRLREIN